MPNERTVGMGPAGVGEAKVYLPRAGWYVEAHCKSVRLRGARSAAFKPFGQGFSTLNPGVQGEALGPRGPRTKDLGYWRPADDALDHVVQEQGGAGSRANVCWTARSKRGRPLQGLGYSLAPRNCRGMVAPCRATARRSRSLSPAVSRRCRGKDAQPLETPPGPAARFA